MINRVHHLGVAVRDADEALGFFAGALGLQVTKDAVLEEQGIRGVLLAAGESEIELLQPIGADTPVGRFLQTRGEGLHHLCFGTDDIEADLYAARARSLPLIDERPRPGLAGMIAFIHPRATCGVLIELAQPPSSSPSAEPVPDNELTVLAFDHVAVAVHDREAGVDAFARNFELAEDVRVDLKEEGTRLASIPVGPSHIEVLQPYSDSGDLAQFLRDRGQGLYQLSLSVRDVQRAQEGLTSRGLSFARKDRQYTPGRRLEAALARSHGVRLEFIQRPA